MKVLKQKEQMRNCPRSEGATKKGQLNATWDPGSISGPEKQCIGIADEICIRCVNSVLSRLTSQFGSLVHVRCSHLTIFHNHHGCNCGTSVTKPSERCLFALVGKILNLLPDDAVDSATRMVLVNALYFKGIWEDQFLVQDTTEKPFRVNKVGTLL